MSKLIPILLVFCCFFVPKSFAQEQHAKSVAAKKIQESIKIDGELNDAAWQDAEAATDFVEWQPNFGAQQPNETKTAVKVVYDDYAIYFGGYCYENMDSITKELVGRDVVGVNDFVGVILDTYNDKINATGFYLTVLGEQFDAKYSSGGNEDGSWNAVWEGETKLHKDGWSFEMRIPYSAVRFSKNINQWGFNITRKRKRAGKQYMWNPVDPKVNGFINQAGLLTNISNINPPLRLSFSPYFSSYLNHYPYKKAGISGAKDLTASINGGMDVKWGIDQNYTLDMTLIPDFGQVQSDQRVLNLSPFEVEYQENRQFFTEGTELFNKGNFFYSRRIGSTPLHFFDVQNNLKANEVVDENPTSTKLINATKVSGRNSKGFGFGLFNAVTKPMYANILDTVTKVRREEMVSPLTNFNIFVVDKSLKNNSSISFLNTSVLRNGRDYDATVTAFMTNLNNKANTLYFNTNMAVSNKFSAEDTKAGYFHTLSYGKGGGNFNFDITQELYDKNFDKNDLGILFMNNYLGHYFFMCNNWRKPTRLYNTFKVSSNFWIDQRFQDMALMNKGFNIKYKVQFKNLMNHGLMVYVNGKGHDFYEPRMDGFFFNSPTKSGGEVWLASNEAKRYYADIAINYFKSHLDVVGGKVSGQRIYSGMGNRFRFNDKLSIATNSRYIIEDNDVGFFKITNSSIPVVFAQRNRRTVENTLNIKYNFNKLTGLSLAGRHYWSKVEPTKFYRLRTSGELLDKGDAFADANFSFNVFNVDMVFFRQFAPGSFINLVWKNAIDHFSNETDRSYFYNLGKTLNSYQANSFSVKIIYFLDYLDIQKKLNKRKTS